jgi:hypothetical protein
MKTNLPYETTGKAIKGYAESVTAKNETNDCVVRAFASSFDIPYDEAHKFVADQFNRLPKRGTFFTAQKITNMCFSGITVNNKKPHVLGTKTRSIAYPFSLAYDVKVKGEVIQRRMTVGTFVKKNPVGTFFVLVKGHAFTIKDGVVIGNVEDAIKTKRPMKAAFLVK